MNKFRPQCKGCYWNSHADRIATASCICPTCENNHCNYGTGGENCSITNWCTGYEDWIIKLVGRKRKGKNVEEPML